LAVPITALLLEVALVILVSTGVGTTRFIIVLFQRRGRRNSKFRLVEHNGRNSQVVVIFVALCTPILILLSFAESFGELHLGMELLGELGLIAVSPSSALGGSVEPIRDPSIVNTASLLR
jgi:hypothetical protein